MKKTSIILALVFVFVLSFSFGILAEDITAPEGDPNQYVVKEAIATGIDSDNLYIGTVGNWNAANEGSKTYFENGEALNANDIIISNNKVGIVLAVGTRNPWGYPAGSILDAGYIKDGTPARDTVWAIEFLSNRWDSWAPDNCGTVTFDLVKYDFNACKEGSGLDAVKVTRDYTIGGADFDVVTYYGAAPDVDYIYVYNQMTNNGEGSVELANSFAITNKGDDGGFMKDLDAINCTGSYGNKEGQEYNTYIALGDASQFDRYKGSLGYRELVADHVYKADESVLMKNYVVINDDASTRAINEFMAENNKVEKQTAVTATVKDAEGKAVENPVVVIEQEGKVYGWYIGDETGKTEFNLPQGGTYSVYVERDGYAQGAVQEVKADKETVALDLVSGAAKETVKFNLKDQNGDPVYGKVELFDAEGNSVYPVVRFCGEAVYQANQKGVIEAEIAPGDYKAVVYGEGFWFYSNAVEVNGNTKDGAKDVTINMEYSAPEGWLSADLHHHGNKNDAFADPEDVIPSMVAAGLDVAFISDHDFTTNNAKAYSLAEQYGLTGFVPSEEISCSWAHFNVIPLNDDSYNYFKDEEQENHVMDQFSQLPEFVQETHDAGAAITANHPWYSYGLFYAYSVDAIPGGYTDDYDNIEINSSSSNEENLETILSTLDLWTSYIDGTSIYNDVNGDPVVTEKAHYLIGGSDTHDVLYPGFADENYKNTKRSSTDYVSGKIRTYAYVGETTDSIMENGLAYGEAVVSGHSYTTYGPLLDMDKLPGDGEYTTSDTFYLNMEIKSLDNIKDILVLTKDADTTYDGLGTSAYSEGKIKYDAEASRLNVNAKEIEFEAKVPVEAGEKTWIAFLVVDVNGSYAITNPYWVVGEGSGANFDDINADAWYAPYVKALVEEEVITGYPDNTFRPENNVTRAEFAKMVYKYAPKAEETKDVEFKDVTNDKWYYESVMYMAENGYINGYPDGTFKPDTNISRAEICTILSNIYGDLTATTEASFSDVQENQWFYDAVMNLANAGYVNGMGDGIFAPDSLATRAQAAKFIYVAVNDGKILLNEVE